MCDANTGSSAGTIRCAGTLERISSARGGLKTAKAGINRSRTSVTSSRLFPCATRTTDVSQRRLQAPVTILMIVTGALTQLHSVSTKNDRAGSHTHTSLTQETSVSPLRPSATEETTHGQTRSRNPTRPGQGPHLEKTNQLRPASPRDHCPVVPKRRHLERIHPLRSRRHTPRQTDPRRVAFMDLSANDQFEAMYESPQKRKPQ